MNDPRTDLRRGLLWLGSAFGAARAIDVGTTIVVLWFLTKAELGAASVVWTIAVFIEAFNGLGIGVAIVQAPSVTRRQLDSAFWFVLLVATVLAAAIIGSGPLLAAFYDDPMLSWYVLAVAAKLYCVGAALLPIQLLNRELQYREIAAIQTLSTLLAAIARIAIAMLGGGAWALILGNALHGFFTMILAQVIMPVIPRLHFAFADIRDLVRYGIKAALGSGVYHLFRNVDYLIVGRLFGLDQLGLYRLAFDIAMEPAIAIVEVVNRTALPVFARVAAVKEKLEDAFRWSVRTLVLLVVPVVVLLSLSAHDLTALIGDAEGDNYAAAAGPLVVLALAAGLRVLFQLFQPLFNGTGHPGTYLRMNLAALAMLLAAITGLFYGVGRELGIVSVALAWLVIYPPLLVGAFAAARRRCGIALAPVLAGLRRPVIVGLAIAALGLAARTAAGRWLPEARLYATVGTVVLCYLLYLRLIARVRFGDLLRPAAPTEAP